MMVLFKEQPEGYVSTDEVNTEDIDDLKDLSLLVKSISDSQKPIIVHNGMLDLMHVSKRLFRLTIDSSGDFPPPSRNTKRVF